MQEVRRWTLDRGEGKLDRDEGKMDRDDRQTNMQVWKIDRKEENVGDEREMNRVEKKVNRDEGKMESM